FLCKLSGVPAAYGYNLMLATIFASLFQLAYAFVAEMTRRLSTRISSSAALLAGIWLCGGNPARFRGCFVKPWLVSFGWVAPPRQAFLISDPTRFVGYDPQTADRLIHEFPAYALYVGDLHGHLSNLPGVLLLLSLVLCWLRAQSRLTHAFASLLPLALSAWLVGIFAMTNSWDALMYGSLLGGLLILAFVQALPTGLVGHPPRRLPGPLYRRGHGPDGDPVSPRQLSPVLGGILRHPYAYTRLAVADSVRLANTAGLPGVRAGPQAPA
ncbi:MAG: hypothetical protein IPN40_15250, partial [Uliginosibacterium sp.]|nr:hypothetical protein [Uliginosibacterium sp.]